MKNPRKGIEIKNIVFSVLLLSALSYISTIRIDRHSPAHTDHPISVYLSSDDGPLVGSGSLDKVVREQKVPLAVFLVGIPLSRDRGLGRYMERYRNNPWIEMGNHSFTHAGFKYRKFYSDPNGVLDDFEKNRNFLKLDTMMARLPGRNIWRLGGLEKGRGSGAEAADLLAEHGYRIYGWDLEWRHDRKGYPLQNAKEIYSSIKRYIKENRTFTPKHLVLLMHDEMFIRRQSIKELTRLIELLRSDYRCALKALSTYPNIDAQKLKNRGGFMSNSPKSATVIGDFCFGKVPFQLNKYSAAKIAIPQRGSLGITLLF